MPAPLVFFFFFPLFCFLDCCILFSPVERTGPLFKSLTRVYYCSFRVWELFFHSRAIFCRDPGPKTCLLLFCPFFSHQQSPPF